MTTPNSSSSHSHSSCATSSAPGATGSSSARASQPHLTLKPITLDQLYDLLNSSQSLSTIQLLSQLTRAQIAHILAHDANFKQIHEQAESIFRFRARLLRRTIRLEALESLRKIASSETTPPETRRRAANDLLRESSPHAAHHKARQAHRMHSEKKIENEKKSLRRNLKQMTWAELHAFVNHNGAATPSPLRMEVEQLTNEFTQAQRAANSAAPGVNNRAENITSAPPPSGIAREQGTATPEKPDGISHTPQVHVQRPIPGAPPAAPGMCRSAASGSSTPAHDDTAPELARAG